jgi:hypothetical protein
MAYGVEIYGPNGGILLDSNAYSMIQTSAAVTTWADNATVTAGPGEVIAIRYDASSAEKTTYISTANSGTSRVFTNESGYTLEYVILKVVKDDGSKPAAEDYGLECFDSSGNITYSSRYTKGFTIEEFHDVDTIEGGVRHYEANSTNIGDHVYTGSDQDVFVTLLSPMFVNYVNPYNPIFSISQYWFETTGKIRFVSYLWLAYSSYFQKFDNWGNIFVFTLRN